MNSPKEGCELDVKAKFIEQFSFIVILERDSVEIARQEVKENGYDFNSLEIVLETGKYNLILDDSSFTNSNNYTLMGNINNYLIDLQPNISVGITFLYQLNE